MKDKVNGIRRLIISILFCLMVILLSTEVSAYVGPGTGISLIGAIIAVLAAVLFTIGGIFLWPFRAFKRWMKKRKGEEPGNENIPPAEGTEQKDD